VLENRGPEQKQQVYDPAFTQSYKVERHDFEIEDYVDQLKLVDYAFSFQPKPIEPFKNS
jgi:hypothetical protein